MANRREYAVHTIIYVGANLFSAGLPFLILPVVSHNLSVEEYGIVSMFTVFVSMFGAFTGLNVHGAIGVRYFQLDETDFRRYVSSCLAILLISTTIAFIIALPFASFLSDISALPWEWILASVVVSGMAFAVQMQLVFWQSAQRPFLFAATRIAQAATDAGLTLALLGQGLTWQARTWAIASATTFAAAFSVISMARSGLLSARPRLSSMRDALAFGIPLIPNVIGALLVGSVDRLIIATHVNLAAAGLYSIAWQIGLVLSLLGDAFSRAVTPWIYQKLSESSTKSLIDITSTIYFASFIFIIIGFLFYYFFAAISPLIFPPEYASAVGLLPWFIAGSVARSIYLLVINIAFFKSATYIASVSSLVSGAIGCLLTWLLVGYVQAHAGGISFVSANFLALIIAIFLSNKIAQLPWMATLGGRFRRTKR